jgi:hypothetical protein
VAAAALFVMAAVMLVYAAVLHLAGRERLRDLVTYVQVVLVVVTAVGYQVGARVIDFQRLGQLDLASKPWIFLLPPAWFAGLVEAVLGNGGTVPWALAALALLAPLACGWAVIRYLADAFFLLFESGGDAGPARPERQPRPGVGETGTTATLPARRSLGQRLGHRLCRQPAERAGFALAWIMMGRDRQTKLRLYPTIGMMLAFAMLPVLDRSGAGAQNRSSGTLFLSLYSVGVFGAMLVNQLKLSEQGAAAEAVRAAPLARPGSYQLGALKALIARLLMPTLAVLLTVLFWRFGGAVAPDLLLAASAALLFLASGALLGRRHLPFSMPVTTLTQARTFTDMLLLMGLAGTVGALHAVLSKFLPQGVWLAIPLVLGLALLCLRAYGRTSWKHGEAGHS